METNVKIKKSNLKGGYRMKNYSKKKISILHNEFIQLFCINRNEIAITSTGCVASKKIYKDSDLTVDFILEQEKINQVLRSGKISQMDLDRAIDKYIIFSRQSYLIYMILFDYYSNNQERIDNEGNLIITFKEIHQIYRNKTLDKFGRIHEDTMKSYIDGLEDLHRKKIKIKLGLIQKKKEIGKEKLRKRYIKDFPVSQIEQNLIEYELIKSERKEPVSVKYKLGDFGKLMLKSKKVSNIVPVELMQLNYKEITKFYIGMYLSRLIFMSRRQKENYKSVNIKHILQNIMCFNIDGSNKGINKYQEIKNAVQKTKLIDTFEEQLKYVLDLFTDKEHNVEDEHKEKDNEITEKTNEKNNNTENKIIKNYELSVDKITSKNYDWDSTVVKLTLK